MKLARRVKEKISYRGQDISESVMDFAYTDNYDQTDDISIRLSDAEEQWLNELFPVFGDTLIAGFGVYDWIGPSDNREINLGLFEIDSVDHNGTLTMRGVAVPITSDVRSEKKNRARVDINLSGIARDIAGSCGLALVYDTDFDPLYDQVDQNDKSDLEFLEELCKSDGLCMKITDSQLIIFEESRYEARPANITISKGDANIIGFPRFSHNAKNTYRACEISYFCSRTNEVKTGYFEDPNAPEVGHTLRLRECYNSIQADPSLNRKSMARLREKNKDEWRANFTLTGDIIYFTGMNVNIEGWGMYDGKYHIVRVNWTNGSGGFRIGLDLRRCLEGY